MPLFCSLYTELTFSAKEDNPQPVVEQFLALYSSLNKATLISESLTKTLSASALSEELQDEPSEEALKLSSGKQKNATSWVQAALVTDLSPFTVFNKATVHSHAPTAAWPRNPVMINGNQPMVVLENTSKIAVSKNQIQIKARPSVSSKPGPSVSSKPATSTAPRRALDGLLASQKTIVPPPIEWSRGGGLGEAAELANSLLVESREWFLGFVERFLDADDASALSDKSQIAAMLSQLKRVNDWLDQVGAQKDDNGENDVVPPEKVEKLRKKIYEYLLTHVESAAIALNGGPATPGRAADPKMKR